MNSFANPEHEQAAAELCGARCGGPANLTWCPARSASTSASAPRRSTPTSGQTQPLPDQLVGLRGSVSRGHAVQRRRDLAATGAQAALTLFRARRRSGRRLFYVRARPEQMHHHHMGGTSFRPRSRSAVHDQERWRGSRGARSRCRCWTSTFIGAGGGSIGWLDEGGLPRMGPQSAGADPGLPAT